MSSELLQIEQLDCYTGLSDEIITSLEKEVQEIHTIVNKATFEIGARLCEVRENYSHNKHGGFDGWIEQRLKFGRTTAYNIMNRYERFSTVQNFEQLDIVLSAQYRLAGASVPQEARDEAIEYATLGKKVTLAKADELIEKWQRIAEEERQKAEAFQQQLLALKPEKEIIYEDTPETQEQLAKLQAELAERTQQRDNLARLEEKLGKELDEQRDANAARREQELYEYRINERVKKVCEEWGRTTVQLLGLLPSPLESQVVTADNWALIEHITDMAERTINTIDRVKSDKVGIFIDSEEVGQSC